MIKINIATNGEKVLDTYDWKDVKLNEVALTIYKLEQAKLWLLDNFEFESEFEMSGEEE